MSIFGSGSSSIGTGIVYSLTDQFSGPADHIMNKFRKLEGVTDSAALTVEKSMTRMKMGFGMMAMGAIMLAPIAMATKVSMEFSKVMSEVGSKSGANAQQMELLRAQSVKLGADTKFSAKEAAEGQAQLAMAGLNVNQILKAMPGMLDLAASGNLDLARSAEIATNIMSQYGIAADKTTRIADVLSYAANASNASVEDISESMKYLGPTAAAFGVSLEESSSIVMALANAGLKGGAATRSLVTSLANLARPTKEASDMMTKLGLNFFDAKGNFVGFNNMIGQMEKSFKGLTQEQKMAAVGAIFQSGSIQEVMGMMNANTVVMRNGQEVTIRGSEALKEYTSQLVNAGGTAQRVSAQMMDNLAGDIEQFKGSVETTAISIGASIQPMIRKVVQGLTILVNLFGQISESPVGNVLLKITTIAGALLLTVGALVIAVTAVKWASAKASIAFLEMGMTEVGTAFATGGLTAGMWALATAVWTALAPLLPFLAAAAYLVGVFLLLRKSVSMFSEVLDGTAAPATEGWLLIMQKVGGVLSGIGEVFSNATADGFTMSEKMHDALQKLGILELVVNIGTWAVRIKAFFSGMSDGFLEVYGVVKIVVGYMIKGFNWIGDVLSSLGIDFFSGMGGIKEWVKWGKYLAITIGALITMAFIPLATAIASFVGMCTIAIAVIEGIIWVVKEVYNAFANWDDTMSSIGDLFGSLMDWIYGLYEKLLSWIGGIGEKFYNWGVSIVTSLWDGIKSVWQSVIDWFSGAIDSLIAPFKSILIGLGLMDDVNITTTSVNKNSTEPSAIGRAVSQGKSQMAYGNTETYTYNTSRETVKDIFVTLPDGRVLAKVVNDQNEQNRTRKSGG